jgi:hypothetical protein
VPAGSDDPAPAAPRPPRADVLQRLPPDAWAVVLRHARGALHELEPGELTPRMEQLRATPTSRLVGGRSRRDLSRLLAAGGPLWWKTSERLRADEQAGGLEAVLRGEAPVPEHDQPRPPAPTARPEREQRLRQRVRELVEQRDQARRRASGLEARLQTERDRADALAAELEQAAARGDELAERLEAAATERQAAVDRVLRQFESQLADAREELRSYRRSEQERRRRRQRRQEARTRAEERAEREVSRFRSARRSRRRHARPGRPSRLPPGIAPGTRDAVAALLAPGRRLLVDGYNVTRQHRGHLPLEQQRLWLIKRLEGLRTRTRVRPTVVFDGQEAAGAPVAPSRTVAVRFTAGGSADDELVAMVGELPEEEPVVVVTDDRELTERLRAHRVDVVATRPFVAELT